MHECLPAGMYVHHTFLVPKEDIESPGTRVIDSRELPCGSTAKAECAFSAGDVSAAPSPEL